MVLPAKIFEIKEKVNLEFIAQIFQVFRDEELYKTEKGETISLIRDFGLRIEG